MRAIKLLVPVLCLLLLTGGKGCETVQRMGEEAQSLWESTDAKETVLMGMRSCMRCASRLVLTPDRTLIGTRTKGSDTLRGGYHADYLSFSGKEYLFGATDWDSDGADALVITYRLAVKSGTARLYVTQGGETVPIADVSAEGTLAVPLRGGDNYLIFSGEGFTGSLDVTIE